MLTGGTAKFMTSMLTVGNHSLAAVYSGDTNFTSSTGTVVQQISAMAATTVVTSSASPSNLNQSVTFTATVTPNTATGTVAFNDGSTTLATVVLSGGTAKLTTTALTGGSHTITAVYSGDASFGTSTGMITQTVNPATTTTAVISSASTSNPGQSVTFSVLVTPSTVGPFAASGTVTFQDGATVLATRPLSAGMATFTTSTLSSGTHPITAVYSGDGSFSGSSGSVVQTVNLTNKVVTTTTVTSSSSASSLNQSVTFTARVNPNTSGAFTAMGTVTFREGTTVLATPALSTVDGTAAFTTSNLTGGSHMIIAEYSGDTNFNPSSGLSSQTVTPQTTTLALAVTPSGPANLGQSLKLTATLSPNTVGSFTATGTVTFKDTSNGTTTTLSTAPLSGNTATFMIATLTPGTHTLTAVYGGDTNFTGSTSAAQTQTVTKQATTTTLAAPSPNPSNLGQMVTLMATVSPSAVGSFTATGMVTFVDTSNNMTLGTATLTGGTATLPTATLMAGNHPIRADYSGDTNFTNSSAAAQTQTVRAANTTTTLSSSTPNPSPLGGAVTFTATVTPSSIGSFVPSGSVAFVDTTTSMTLGTMMLSGGTASLTTSVLGAGSHNIQAVFTSSSTNFTSSNSLLLSRTVNAQSTTTSVPSSNANPANPTTPGNPRTVTFTATVSPSSVGGFTATGSVSFRDRGIEIGRGTLSNGTASLTIATGTILLSGRHTITAVYLGDSNFSASPVSPALTQDVRLIDSDGDQNPPLGNGFENIDFDNTEPDNE
jgi:hypothetical protein